MSESLFTAHQLFFTGKYTELLELQSEDYTGTDRVEFDVLQARSLIALGRASEIIATGEDPAYKAVKEYSSGKKSAKLEQLVNEHGDEEQIAVIGALYFLKQGNIEKAQTILSSGVASPEKTLLLVEVLLAQNQLKKAEQVFKQSGIEDGIIANLAENLLNSVSNGENLRSALYSYEELSHQYPSLVTLLGSFVINLQLNQVPEAEIVLAQLEELGIKNDDLLANEVAYYQIKGDSKTAESKRLELEKLNPEHPAVKDFKEKSSLFNDVVDKYKEQIN